MSDRLATLISSEKANRFRRATHSDHGRGYIGWVIQGSPGGYERMVPDPNEIDHSEVGWSGGARFRYYVEYPKKTVVWNEPPEDDEKFAAENWLYRKGEKVARHWTVTDYAERLEESIGEPNTDITIDDFMKNLESRWVDRDFKSHLQTVEHFYYSDRPGDRQMMEDYFKVLNKVKDHVLAIAQRLGIPHVSLSTIKYFLIHQQEFRMDAKEFFPFPLYIAATKNADGDWAEIGIMVDESGKVLEIHEGNDEASPETIHLANKLVNPQGKPVRIYGAHGISVVQKIEQTGYLPANLYVSKDRGHASGHLDLKGERTMFTGIIDINSVSQESDLDWRTMGPTKIEKFRYL